MRRDSCDFDHQLLSRYVSCECDSTDRMRVERHVRTCRICRHELYQLEEVWSLLEEWEVDETDAPYRPEDLRAGLLARFGGPEKLESWRKKVSSLLSGWGSLRPVPVAVMVGVIAAVLSWWDAFLLPDVADSTDNHLALVTPTPVPKIEENTVTQLAKDLNLEQVLRDMDRNARRLRRIQTVAGVRIAGPPEEILFDLNRPLLPFPSTPPKNRVIFASADGRL